MDLRGLSPEDVYHLMGTGLGMKQMEIADAYRRDQMKQQDAQNQVMNQFRRTDDQMRMADLMLKAGEAKSEVHNINGKQVQVVTDRGGNILDRRVLGDAPSKSESTKLLKDAEGNPYWAKPGDPIKPGSSYLGDTHSGLGVNDQYTVMSLKNAIENGGNVAGIDYDSESNKDNAMSIVNNSDPNEQFVKIPTRQQTWFGGEKVVPEYIKIPKDPARIMALGDDKVIGYRPQSNHRITVRDIKEFAAAKNVPVNSVLKYFGIIK